MSGLTPKDIQGDIIHQLPKNYENFLFFHIDDPKQFRAAIPTLLELQPPATGERVMEVRKQLSTWDKSQGQRMSLSLFNIGFSKDGLKALSIPHKALGDHHFSRGQLEEAQELGDPMVMRNGELVPNWEVEFLELNQSRKIHGIILLAGEKTDVLNHGTEIFKVLEGAASVVYRVEGHTLKSRETEHFGWVDGISNPVVPGLTTEERSIAGQHIVKPGVLLVGADGDPMQKDRPDWALGGSFMVFRKLKQYVPEFKQFLVETAIKQGVDPSDPSALKKATSILCGRVFGRWKNGAPLQLTPFESRNDPEYIKDENINNFEFDQVEEPKCPYGAHIRKVNPRNDIDKEKVLSSSIMRRGIPYGEEFDEKSPEGQAMSTMKERGLAFVAYQSSIHHGFRKQQMDWANDPEFPPHVGTAEPGYDGIIGQNGGLKRQGVLGIQLKEFVQPRAGGYFFVPSINALKTKFSDRSN